MLWRCVQYLLPVVVTAALILLSPPPPKSEICVMVRNSAGPLTVVMNCDSHLFVRLAREPGRFFTNEGNVLQSRPLFLALGWAFALPLRALDRILVWAGADSAQRPDPFYFGYIALNALLLALLLAMFIRLLGSGSIAEWALVLPVAVLLINNVTKAFFWTPHLQILSMLTPLLAVALSMWLHTRSATLSLRRITFLGFAIGLAGLAYGAFLVVVAAGVVTLLLDGRRALSQRAAKAFVLAASFASPIIAWVAFVTATYGSFYNHEVGLYRQFVWILDAAPRGIQPFASEVVQKLDEFGSTFPSAVAFPGALLVVALIVARLLRIPVVTPDNRELVRAIAIYTAVAIPFYWLMGFYETRLTWVLVPPMLLVLAAAMRKLDSRLAAQSRIIFRLTTASIALAYVIHTLSKYGPYS